MNDIFEAAKRDPEVKSEYKLLPWKNRGRKYFIEGTRYDQLLVKIGTTIHDAWSTQLCAGNPEHAQILPAYIKQSIDTVNSICRQVGDTDKSVFASRAQFQLFMDSD